MEAKAEKLALFRYGLIAPLVPNRSPSLFSPHVGSRDAMRSPTWHVLPRRQLARPLVRPKVAAAWTAPILATTPRPNASSCIP
jgi:hypothetical protein